METTFVFKRLGYNYNGAMNEDYTDCLSIDDIKEKE